MVYLEIFHIDEPRRFTIRNEAKAIEEGLLSDLPYVTSDNQTRRVYCPPLEADGRSRIYFQGPTRSAQVLRTCKQIYAEAGHLLFGEHLVVVLTAMVSRNDDVLSVTRPTISQYVTPLMGNSLQSLEVQTNMRWFSYRQLPGHYTECLGPILRQGNDVLKILPPNCHLKLIAEWVPTPSWRNYFDNEEDYEQRLVRLIREWCRFEGFRIPRDIDVTLKSWDAGSPYYDEEVVRRALQLVARSL